MTLVGFSPDSQIIDPRTGLLTRDGFNLVQFFVEAVNGAGAVLTVDGIQVLTNKTINGDHNTLEEIGTNSLADRTGDDNSVVTGSRGRPGFVGEWDANGDLVEGPEVLQIVTSDEADETYLRADGLIPASGPVLPATYTVATVPAAASYPAGIIYVSDESGGATLAFSDSTDWRRTSDRAIIS